MILNALWSLPAEHSIRHWRQQLSNPSRNTLLMVLEHFWRFISFWVQSRNVSVCLNTTAELCWCYFAKGEYLTETIIGLNDSKLSRPCSFAGIYVCGFTIGAIMHKAEAQLKVALLPDTITLKIRPLTVDCSQGQETVDVHVTANILNSTESFGVWWSYMGVWMSNLFNTCKAENNRLCSESRCVISTNLDVQSSTTWLAHSRHNNLLRSWRSWPCLCLWCSYQL